jgi:pyrimidine-nucleoside phosphorylase
MHLGAGRRTKEDEIDLGAGIHLHKKTGDFVEKNELLATLYSSNIEKLKEGKKELLEAYQFSAKKIPPRPLIHGFVGK